MFITSEKCGFTPVYFTGHHLLFLRLYNNDDCLAQSMNYVGLMDRDPICPIFMGFKSSDLVSHGSEFRMPSVSGFLSNHMKLKCLRMCENCNFPTVAKNINSSRRAINQLLTGRNRTGRGGCVVWLL